MDAAAPEKITRKQGVTLLLLGLTVCCMSSDQNLMAPNLTAARAPRLRPARRQPSRPACNRLRAASLPLPALPAHSHARAALPPAPQIAHDFGFTDAERDSKLGGQISVAFFCIGAPVALLAGWLGDQYSRKNLFVAVVLLGEGPCLGTYWVRTYWQLFALRTLTGIAIGGTPPLIYSLLGDLFPARRGPGGRPAPGRLPGCVRPGAAGRLRRAACRRTKRAPL